MKSTNPQTELDKVEKQLIDVAEQLTTLEEKYHDLAARSIELRRQIATKVTYKD